MGTLPAGNPDPLIIIACGCFLIGLCNLILLFFIWVGYRIYLSFLYAKLKKLTEKGDFG